MEHLESFRRMLLEQLAAGGGLEALVQAAGKYLGQSFSVCDAAYTLLATAAPKEDDGVFVPQASGRWIMRPEIVEELQQKGITAQLQKSREAFSLYNASSGLWEVFCALSTHKQVTGYLFLRSKEQPDPAGLERWSALAQALSVELQKGEYNIPGPRQPAQAEIFRQLVEGEISDEGLILQRLRQTGWRPGGPYRLGCLVCMEAPLFSGLGHEPLLRQVGDLLPGSLCCWGRENLLLLTPAALLGPEEPVKLLHWLGYHQFTLAVSMPFDPLLEAPQAHAQAQTMVKALLRCAQARAPRLPGPICRFEEHFPLACFLLSHPARQAEACLHPHIRLFREHDRTRGTAYIPTLRAYFAHNRSTTAAAAALYIHKTTLFYRLEQMEKLAGPFLKDPKLLFLYEYSLGLLDLLPEKPGEG